MVDGPNPLKRLLQLESDPLSIEVAKHILSLHFAAVDHTRCEELSTKANEGTLNSAESSELDEYLAASDVLAILQSMARKSLNVGAKEW
jgi:hypothetical protein